jgi:hypothetical protein
MRRQHGDAGAIQVGDRHQHPVPRAGLVTVGGTHLVAVAQCRLVAVVAVGDEQLLVEKVGARGGGEGGIAHDPEVVAGAAAVSHRVQGWLRAGLGTEALELPGRVGEQREDRAEVGVNGAHQPQAVLLGPGEGGLVGEDGAGVERLQAHAAKEGGEAVELAPGIVILDAAEVKRRLLLPDQDAL